MNKRLPTIKEWQELMDTCIWKWDDKKKGMKVTGKNGKSIFLPAEGYWEGNHLNFVGSYGDYWSSSHSTVNSYLAYYVFFSSDYVNMDNCYHFYGHPVRLVSDIKEDGFIDLGLPSGLLWAENNIEGYYTFDEAIKIFEHEGIGANEDENIRKHIIDIIRENAGLKSIPCDVEIDYLKKMKDASKAIEAVERIDRYIDTQTANAHDMKDSNPDKKYYRGWDDALGKMAGILQDVYSVEKQKEPKPAEWSKEDENYYDAIITKLEVTQDDAMLTDNQMDFLKSLPKRFNLQPKQEWSEEDEKQIRQIERVVKEAGCTPQLQKQIHNFLKSLRPQSKEELAKMLQDEYNKGKEIGEREGYTKGFNDAAFGGKLKEWSKEDVKSFNNVLSGLKYTYEDLVNHKSFDSAEDVKNAFDWFKFLPERLNLQPEQEWDKEDEIRRESCMLYLANARDCIEFNPHIGDNAKESAKKEIQKDIDWLKKL